jgi:hypothetical protein
MELKEYFQSYKNYFWEWVTDEDISDDSGYNENNLISIPNVGAITYRPYLIGVLKELQQQGLPPLGSLLLVLYATQNSYVNLDGVFYHLRNLKTREATQKNIDIVSACNFLENLKNVGNSYKKGQNKINLIQTIFKNSHNLVSGNNAELILKVLEKRPYKIEESAIKEELTDSVIAKDIRALSILYEKFPTTESIIEAMKGIVDEPVLEDEVVDEETTVETDKDFIQELIDDPKTFQVGSLIKRIWSGLKIPMRHLSPGEQPIGGISDMTNKGELHRMLLSEFANEDEVFMNRVANNEALFIQREIPPEENIFERIILIDTSLKNWGTPKVLAFASAIAVIKHPKAHSECKVFALGQTSVPISLNKVEEVVENLNQVSPVLEVSTALDKFLQEEHTEKDLEVFFITNQENLANQSLQKVIHENRDRLKFLVTTSSDGELNFYKHHKGTRKHLQKIMLPLQELWSNPPKNKQKGGRNVSANGKKTDLPLNYPLLFPAPSHKIATFLFEGEFFILSNKKQLLRTYLSGNYYDKHNYEYFKIHRGCEVLFEDISVKPRGEFALARNKQQHYILCQYQKDKKLISKLNINTKEYSELNLTGLDIPPGYQLIYFNKNFYLYQTEVSQVYKINVDGNISLESIDNKTYDIEKNYAKAEVEIAKLNRSGIKILSNFNKIGINTENNLVISGNALTKLYVNSLRLEKNRYDFRLLAEQNKNKFTFSDGSEIITDSRGMLTFNSSSNSIPTFYMPSTEYGYLSLATNTEFGGSEYYLPENSLLKVKKMEDMYSEYLKAFIDQILNYAVED